MTTLHQALASAPPVTPSNLSQLGPADKCDEKTALDVMSTVVENEFGCATGWQEVSFGTPVAITANTILGGRNPRVAPAGGLLPNRQLSDQCAASAAGGWCRALSGSQSAARRGATVRAFVDLLVARPG